MRQTITIYYDPRQEIAHTLGAQVNEETGEHTITSSHISTMNAEQFGVYVRHQEELVGPANLRAYIIAEAKR